MQWPYRHPVPDPNEPGTLHVFFSGTEGFHGDLFSTQALDNIKAANYFGQAPPFPDCQDTEKYPLVAGCSNTKTPQRLATT